MIYYIHANWEPYFHVTDEETEVPGGGEATEIPKSYSRSLS